MPSTSVCTALSVYPQKGEIVPRRCAAIFVADRTPGEGHRFLVVVFFSFFTRAEDAFDVEFCVCTRKKTIVSLRGGAIFLVDQKIVVFFRVHARVDVYIYHYFPYFASENRVLASSLSLSVLRRKVTSVLDIVLRFCFRISSYS